MNIYRKRSENCRNIVCPKGLLRRKEEKQEEVEEGKEEEEKEAGKKHIPITQTL